MAGMRGGAGHGRHRQLSHLKWVRCGVLRCVLTRASDSEMLKVSWII